MTTPQGPEDITASTFDFAGTVIAAEVRAFVTPTHRLLDVGAGWGKYRWLLPEYEMDAVEVHRPYVRACSLDSYYRIVTQIDVCGMQIVPYSYGGVIFGDVLEHLPVECAKRLIFDISAHTPVWVAVPFRMPQGPEEDNPWEVHVQDDLDEEVMYRRYPDLRLVGTHVEGNGFIKAVYTSM